MHYFLLRSYIRSYLGVVRVCIYIYTRKYFSNIISLKSNMNKQTYLLFGITIQM
jgi:hypothetical protein